MRLPKIIVMLSVLLAGIPCANAEDPARVFSGVWADVPGFGEANCFGLLALSSDGTFHMNQCNYRECTVTALAGTWQVER